MSKRLLLPQVAFDFIFQTFPDFFFSVVLIKVPFWIFEFYCVSDFFRFLFSLTYATHWEESFQKRYSELLLDFLLNACNGPHKSKF